MIIGKWNKSVILTYIGLGFAILGMYFSLTKNNILYAISCLIIAGVCDLFDGFVARKCKRTEEEKNFGIELDSLVDVISFLILPVVIFIGCGYTSWYHFIIYLIFCLCGIARLAYFNIKIEDNSKPIKYYEGLPVTFTALLLPLFYLLTYVLNKETFDFIYPFTILIIAIFNILKIKIKKPSGLAYLFFSLLAFITLILYLVIL